jgi:hypothetical protein
MANNVLLTVELTDGTRGYGEAAPLPPYNGETQHDAMAALETARSWIVGRDARHWRELAGEFRQRRTVRSGSAQCALEMAVIDALLRHERKSMWEYFGGHGCQLETDMTVTTGTAEQAAIDTRAIRARLHLQMRPHLLRHLGFDFLPTKQMTDFSEIIHDFGCLPESLSPQCLDRVGPRGAHRGNQQRHGCYHHEQRAHGEVNGELILPAGNSDQERSHGESCK